MLYIKFHKHACTYNDYLLGVRVSSSALVEVLEVLVVVLVEVLEVVLVVVLVKKRLVVY